MIEKRPEIKTGDIVEVLPGAGNAGVEDGEQGIVVDGSNQMVLEIIFPANPKKCWSEDNNCGWLTGAGRVKLIQRWE